MKAVLLFALLCCLGVWAHAETHVLTDNEGRTIECELVDYRDGQVTFFASNKRYSLPLSRFSETSRRAILDWAVNFFISRGDLLIDIKGPRRANERDASGNLLTRVSYDVLINNRSPAELDGLEIHYKVYWLDGRVDTGDPFYFWSDHIERIGSIKPREEKQFMTGDLLLKERRDRKDSPIGVWARVYRNGVYLKDISDPSGLATKQKWLNFSLDAIE